MENSPAASGVFPQSGENSPESDERIYNRVLAACDDERHSAVSYPPEPEWEPQPDGTALFDMTNHLPPALKRNILREAAALKMTGTEYFTALCRTTLAACMRHEAAKMEGRAA